MNIFNKTQNLINRKLIKAIEKALKNSRAILPIDSKARCNLILFPIKRIRKLNKELFNRNSLTDVISINNPIYNKKVEIKNTQEINNLGDIYICPEVISKNAEKYGTSFQEELARVIIHGILHLLGYDHKKPFGESSENMFKIQEELIEKIKTN